MAKPSQIDAAVAAVRGRAAERLEAAPAGEALPPYDAAWAVLALAAHGAPAADLAPLRSALASRQLGDGRVPVDAKAPDSHWPTALAVLAWTGGAEFDANRRLATRFLLEATGAHWERKPDSPAAHDPSIRGWPWAAHAHSWVQPTSTAIIALKAVGLGEHDRVAEAVRMLMDRQLPSGGWNFGNTKVFGAELRPYPEDTGYAAAALAGSVQRARVAASIAYLKSRASSLRAPCSLSWALLGLAAWRERPEQGSEWIEESLQGQSGLAGYSLRALAQLVVGHHARFGLAAMLTGDR